MSSIVPLCAGQETLLAIQKVAYSAWDATYRAIISTDQFDYMFQWMYSLSALQDQMEIKQHSFYGGYDAGQLTGFVSVEWPIIESNFAKVHKLYVDPNLHKTGLGRQLLQRVFDEAKIRHCTEVRLNVNKNNSAQAFYEKLGFQLLYAEVIDIGQGYVMDDYVMGIKL
ncbi:MAG: GNAT family N-acetyltransferase [Flavobacterium sp. BFFFF2]|nr:MAG: GNAT family N-acetyltransferase [Flavobacterium sp. BFFFF2]